MPQTNNSMTMKNAKVEISTNKTSWVDVSGYANSVSVDGGERATESQHTFLGDVPIQGVGKRDLTTVTVSVVYTEEAQAPSATIQSAYESGEIFYLRWSPKGGTSGSKQYSIDGIVKNPAYPGGEASSAAPVLIELVVEGPEIHTETVA